MQQSISVTDLEFPNRLVTWLRRFFELLLLIKIILWLVLLCCCTLQDGWGGASPITRLVLWEANARGVHRAEFIHVRSTAVARALINFDHDTRRLIRQVSFAVTIFKKQIRLNFIINPVIKSSVSCPLVSWLAPDRVLCDWPLTACLVMGLWSIVSWLVIGLLVLGT